MGHSQSVDMDSHTGDRMAKNCKKSLEIAKTVKNMQFLCQKSVEINIISEEIGWVGVFSISSPHTPTVLWSNVPPPFKPPII